MVMARIYTRCGEVDKAIAELDTVLAHGSLVTAHQLQLLGWTEPLRTQPGYQALISKYNR
jgi:hypothetical protein